MCCLFATYSICPSLFLHFLLQQEFNLLSHRCFSSPLFLLLLLLLGRPQTASVGWCPAIPPPPPPALSLSLCFLLHLYLSNSHAHIFLSLTLSVCLSPSLPLSLPPVLISSSSSFSCTSSCSSFFIALLQPPPPTCTSTFFPPLFLSLLTANLLFRCSAVRATDSDGSQMVDWDKHGDTCMQLQSHSDLHTQTHMQTGNTWEES